MVHIETPKVKVLRANQKNAKERRRGRAWGFALRGSDAGSQACRSPKEAAKHHKALNPEQRALTPEHLNPQPQT